MNTLFRYTIFVLSIIIESSFMNAQFSKNMRIGDIDFSYVDKEIIIEYSVFNLGDKQKYDVHFYFVDKDSNRIEPKFIKGDVSFQSNGSKTIVWDINKQGITLNGDYYVRIFAYEQTNNSYLKPIAYSGALPGLGSYIIKKKSPTYLWGILGYGMLGSSIYFNVEAQKAKHEYLYHSDTPYEADEYFKQSLKHKSISNLSTGIAIVIWSVFIADAIIATKHNRQIQQHPENNDISLPYISSVSKTKPLNHGMSIGKQFNTK